MTVRLRRIWAKIEAPATQLFAVTLYALIVVGVVAYVYRYIGALVKGNPVDSPLQLASIAAALGMFILIGAFYREKSVEGQKPLENGKLPLHSRLRRAAKLFLAAAASFTIVFLLLEAVVGVGDAELEFAHWILIGFTSLSIVIAGISFSMALASLVTVIRHL